MKNDLVSRQEALNIRFSDAINEDGVLYVPLRDFTNGLKALPPARPDEEKISDTLYKIYRNTSPHTSAEGVAATKYYIREIYREIFGKEGPKWMK